MDFAKKVLLKFRDQSIQTLQILTQASRSKDGQLATRSAHTLKGMAATVAAEPLQEAAAAAEQESHAGNWDTFEKQLQQLQEKLDCCLEFIPNALENLQESTYQATK